MGIVVVDQRLAAHGYTIADGIVLEGSIVSSVTQGPLAGHVRLERIESPAEGGYRYVRVAEVKSNEAGCWVIKNAPAGRHRLVVEVDGHASRVVGYGPTDDPPRWQSYRCVVAPAVIVAGRVTDDAGQPLVDVDVRLADVTTGQDGRYDSGVELLVRTDADGTFRFTNVPQGACGLGCQTGLLSSRTWPDHQYAGGQHGASK